MSLNWIKSALLSALLVLSGCATDPEKLLPHGDATMLDIWNQQTAGSGDAPGRRLLDARQTLRRPLQAPVPVIDQTSYTRTAQTEIYRQFQRLPNPDLVLYVFPHLSGSESVPVPGYSTVFPLYQRVQYALPGERVEDY
ncbi:MAG TPA: TIGR03751 family conjugal transfer lipoprotein [Pseudomonas sp.]|uniref:TIGR03751 family conjugal transfer lipoprotein n=1 Tax=Pseudomonas sp. TaxID=306 RepID=UPI000EBEC84D|nr:TIGR03751 family conjugal transfer lipoprotein [Pseudomonas sp.]HCN61920.1 TIGR03751 family conjugal transfer lipoprotein [Pseudomonas sp.]